MFSPPQTGHRFTGSSWLSVAAHALVMVVFVFSLRHRPVRVFTLPGTASGTHRELAYLPGRAPAPAVPTHTKAKVKAAPTPPTPVKTPPALPHLTVTEAAPSPAAVTPDATAGSDSWGDGSIQIALTTYSPSPKPDLSALPRGIQGDVVVDVTIDPSGKVADLAVLHGLGYGIESSVIGTLKTWVFRPATKDGTPIASVQELHFHFGPV
jgi:periplasmic protein TonB